MWIKITHSHYIVVMKVNTVDPCYQAWEFWEFSSSFHLADPPACVQSVYSPGWNSGILIDVTSMWSAEHVLICSFKAVLQGRNGFLSPPLQIQQLAETEMCRCGQTMCYLTTCVRQWRDSRESPTFGNKRESITFYCSWNCAACNEN